MSKKRGYWQEFFIFLYLTLFKWMMMMMAQGPQQCSQVGFHLHLLVFPLVNQFNSIIGLLVHSSFANDKFRRISTSFHQHFTIISKFVCCGCYKKMNVAFTLISLAVLKWDDCSSDIWVTGWETGPLLLELEANWLDQNVNELKFELSRI